MVGGVLPTAFTPPDSRFLSLDVGRRRSGVCSGGFDLAFISDSRKGKLHFHLTVQKGEKTSTASPFYSFTCSSKSRRRL